MHHEEYNSITTSKTNDEKYIKFAKNLFSNVVLPTLNNFIRILREKYGQYWIEEIPKFNSKHESIGSYCARFNMKWSNDSGTSWNDFKPSNLVGRGVTVIMQGFEGFQNYISKNDWDDILQELKTDHPPIFPLQSMVKCWSFFDQNEIERSVIEGITSLELAVGYVIKEKLSRFNKSIKDINTIKHSDFPEKITLICSFHNLISSTELENSLLMYKLRNNLVHEGIIPDIGEVKLNIRGLLNTISKLLLDKSFRFPSVNSGNSFRDVESWNQLQKEHEKNKNSSGP